MDLYHSRLTPDDLNDLIIKYKIPHDLHPRLPFEDFMMSELLDNAIGIYHRMFDFYGVQIPFSSFLLTLIKHYKVYFSQLGPLGLNKVITFKVLCRSLQIEPMVTLFRVFQTLCKQGDWFSFAKCRAPSLVNLQRLPFYCTPPAAANVVNPDPTPEDLAAGHVAKRTRSALAQSSGSTTRPNLFVGNSDDESDGDDDACVEIPLVTPFCSATMILSSRNQGQSSTTPAAEGSNTRDSQGKGIMVNDAAAPSGGASRLRPSSRPAPSFKDVSDDAIHMDFFPFSAGPYYATYPEGGVTRNCEFTREEWDTPYQPTFGVLTKEVFKDPAVCKIVVDQFPTPGEMVRVESLSDDQLTTKMSVLHCMMMSHGGELLARYRGLNQSHHEYVLSTDSRLKGYEKKSKAKGKESVESLVLCLIAESKKEHRYLASGCESETNSDVRLLRNSGGDSGPDLSFDKSASSERLRCLLCSGFLPFLDDLNDLIIKYKIPRDLHPRLPLEDFVMSELPDDAIAIDDPRPAAGSFNMADVRRLSAHVINLKDMPEGVLVLSGLSRIWKSRVCDLVLRGANRNVMGIHDFLCLPEWTGAEVQEEPHLDVRTTLQRLPFYCTPSAAAEDVIPDPTPEDLTASTSGVASSHVAKSIRSALAQSSGSTTRPSLFVGNDDESDDDDDDACVEIPLVTPLCSAIVIPSSGNQGGSSIAPTAEGSTPEVIALDFCLTFFFVFFLCLIMFFYFIDSRGKAVMVDVVTAASSFGMSRPRPSSGPAPSFKYMFGDAIQKDFFPFSAGPYYATNPEGGVAGNYKFPTPSEMVRVESLSDDQLAAKMSVLHCMMMSHGGELLARYHGLNQSHHEYVLSADSRLKGYEEKVAKMSGLKLQVAALKKQVSGLNDKLTSYDASFAKSKAKGKERKKKIKSLAERDEEILRLKDTPPEFSSFFRGQFQGLVQKILTSDEFSRVQGELLSLAASARFECGLSMHRTKDEFATVLKKMVNFMPGAQDRLAEASPLVAQTDYAFLNKISEYATKPLSVILQLEPKKLVHPANVPILRGTHVSLPIVKESTVIHVFESLELFANVNFTASAVASEHNKEMVNAKVDVSDPKMTDDTAAVKSGHAFVRGISVALDDVMELVEVGSGRVPSGPDDFVVSLSAYEKGNGLDSSSTAGEEAAVNPLGS
ncbi:hypothetical protein Tco_0172430 [Tanacetum coccineum]